MATQVLTIVQIIIQSIFGAASIYSLFSQAIALAISFMLIGYFTGMIFSHFTKKKKGKTPA